MVLALGVGMGVDENVAVRVDVKVADGATPGYAGAVQPPSSCGMFGAGYPVAPSVWLAR